MSQDEVHGTICSHVIVWPSSPRDLSSVFSAEMSERRHPDEEQDEVTEMVCDEDDLKDGQ